jgi:hypothetical protein
MINWNAIATPPRPVPMSMQLRIGRVHFQRYKGDFDFLAVAMDETDRNYFGPQPAEPNARGAQADLFGGAA